MTEVDWTTHPWLFCLGDHFKSSLTDSRGRYPAFPQHALKKSWDLLMEHLDKDQQRSLRKAGSFIVVGPQSTLIVTANWSHLNVVDPDKRLMYCTMPTQQMPLWDHLLTQVLAIKYNWTYFENEAIPNQLNPRYYIRP